PFSFYSSRHPRDLPSFPTRRSSDLDISLSCSPCRFAFHRAVTLASSSAVGGVAASFSSSSSTASSTCRSVTSAGWIAVMENVSRSEEHTSELQSRENLVCRLLLEKK